MTATRQRHQSSSRVMATLRHAADTLRYVNDELVRANEAIFRPAGAPRPRPPAGSSFTGSTEATATEHTPAGPHDPARRNALLW